MNLLTEFVARSNGQHLKTTTQDEGQCTAVIHSWEDFLGLPKTFGHAKDMYGKDPANWDWVRNTPGGIPPPGAQIIWGPMPGNPYGHIALVISANKNNFTSLDQNWPAGDWRYNRARPVYHDYGYVIGWGIPKKDLGGGGQMDVRYIEDWAREAYIIAIGRIPTRDERKSREKLPWDQAFNEIYGSPEAVAAKKRRIKAAYIGILNRDPSNPMSDAELANRVATLDVSYTYQQFVEELLASPERKALEAELAKRKTVAPTPAPPPPPAAEDPTKKPTTPTGPTTPELPPAQQPTAEEVQSVLTKLFNWIMRK